MSRVSIVRTRNKRRKLANGARIFTRGGKNLVGLTLILGVFDVARVEELETALHANTRARVASVGVVAGIRNQRGPHVFPIYEVGAHGVAPVHFAFGVKRRVLVEGVVVVPIIDQPVGVIQSSYRRR